MRSLASESCISPLRCAVLLVTVASWTICGTLAHSSHGSTSVKCPGSPAGFHAWLSIEASVSGSCSQAKDEVKARVAGQSTNAWDDPHGDGEYTLVSDNDEGVTVDRKSSNGRYTDRVLFTFTDAGSSCTVGACSESQGSSGGDQSTNLCNSWNLLCTSDLGCCHVLHDLKPFSYTVAAKSSGAGTNSEVCLGGMGGSGGGFAGEKQTSCPTPPPTSGPEPEPEPDADSNQAPATTKAENSEPEPEPEPEPDVEPEPAPSTPDVDNHDHATHDHDTHDHDTHDQSSHNTASNTASPDVGSSSAAWCSSPFTVVITAFLNMMC